MWLTIVDALYVHALFPTQAYCSGFQPELRET